MAKKKRSSIGPGGVSDTERRRWQAEEIVNRSLQQTPAYKKVVVATAKKLQAAENSARLKLRGKG